MPKLRSGLGGFSVTQLVMGSAPVWFNQLLNTRSQLLCSSQQHYLLLLECLFLSFPLSLVASWVSIMSLQLIPSVCTLEMGLWQMENQKDNDIAASNKPVWGNRVWGWGCIREKCEENGRLLVLFCIWDNNAGISLSLFSSHLFKNIFIDYL